MQHLYFYFDDSGVLHPSNLTGKFVYAGYVFTSKEKEADAKRRYRTLATKIAHKLERVDELKASSLRPKYKQKLFNVVRQEEKLVIVVSIDRIHENILKSPKTICRYKDYILKRGIKQKVRELIQQCVIADNEDLFLHINIDEQLTATDGIYGLAASIKEELQYGISNYNYGTFYPPLINGEVKVDVKYWDSSNNCMIQAADVLANRFFVSYRDNCSTLRKMGNIIFLTFP